MKTFFGEVFSKISNGIFMGCLGVILACWGLYECNDMMMLVGFGILALGFILAVTNEERVIKEKNDLKESNKRLKRRLDDKQHEIEKLQDAVLYLMQDMEDTSRNFQKLSDELKIKTATVEMFKKIKIIDLIDNRNREGESSND